MAKTKNYFIATSTETNFLFCLLATLTISIQKIMTRNKLTQYLKVRGQIDTIEKLGIKLKYDVNDRDQIHNLPNI